MFHKKQLVVSILFASLLVNGYFILLPKKLNIVRDISWSNNHISARGYLEPLNYKGPKDWNTIFFIDVFDTYPVEKRTPKFYAQEVVITNNTVVSLDLKEFQILKIDSDEVIAKDDVYTFVVKKNEVLITDRDGQVARLSYVHSIEL